MKKIKRYKDIPSGNEEEFSPFSYYKYNSNFINKYFLNFLEENNITDKWIDLFYNSSNVNMVGISKFLNNNENFYILGLDISSNYDFWFDINKKWKSKHEIFKKI